MNLVIDGGLSLTLKAGGQHIVLNPSGIWMTTPKYLGGVPMIGTPAAALTPLSKVKGIVETFTPPVSNPAASSANAAPITNIGGALRTGTAFIQVCQMPNGGTPADCPLTDCPCRNEELEVD